MAKGDPASLSSGQKFELVSDWVSPKDSRFAITRSYRTDFSMDRYLGLVWQSNYSDRLHLLWPAIKWRLMRSNGDWHEFIDRDGQWGPTGNWQPTEADTKMTLTQSGYLATVTDGKGVAYGTSGYSTTVPFAGSMTSSSRPGGVDQTTNSYDGAYHSTVTNALGRQTVYTFVDLPNVEGRRISTIDGVATPN